MLEMIVAIAIVVGALSLYLLVYSILWFVFNLIIDLIFWFLYHIK